MDTTKIVTIAGVALLVAAVGAVAVGGLLGKKEVGGLTIPLLSSSVKLSRRESSESSQSRKRKDSRA